MDSPGAEGALGEADVGDDALVGVVVRVEDEALERRGRVALGRRHPFHDGLQHRLHVGAVLGRDEDDLLARDGQHVLELLDDDVRLGRGQVDLVEDGDDDEALRQRQVDVGQGLGLDALRGVDDEDGALAGLQAAADLVGEVDVAGRVDEVEPVAQAIARDVLQVHGAGLDGDALLALEVHAVEDLAHHLALVEGVGDLQETVGQRRLAVVDVGDDARSCAGAPGGSVPWGCAILTRRVLLERATPLGADRPHATCWRALPACATIQRRARQRRVVAPYARQVADIAPPHHPDLIEDRTPWPIHRGAGPAHVRPRPSSASVSPTAATPSCSRAVRPPRQRSRTPCRRPSPGTPRRPARPWRRQPPRWTVLPRSAPSTPTTRRAARAA